MRSTSAETTSSPPSRKYTITASRGTTSSTASRNLVSFHQIQGLSLRSCRGCETGTLRSSVKATPSLLPQDDRFHTAQAGLQHVINKYSPLLSPTSHRFLTHDVQQALSDGRMLHSQVNSFIRDKRQRSEAYAKTRKRGPLARPEGVFVTSSSLPELRAQFDRHEKAATKADTRRQLRITINFIRGEIKEIDDQYKKTKNRKLMGKSRP
jgi:hypothetical protein